MSEDQLVYLQRILAMLAGAVLLFAALSQVTPNRTASGSDSLNLASEVELIATSLREPVTTPPAAPLERSTAAVARLTDATPPTDHEQMVTLMLDWHTHYAALLRGEPSSDSLTHQDHLVDSYGKLMMQLGVYQLDTLAATLTQATAGTTTPGVPLPADAPASSATAAPATGSRVPDVLPGSGAVRRAEELQGQSEARDGSLEALIAETDQLR